jgi:hypothetical protein
MQTITSTWTGATATFQDGLFVFDAPAFNTSTSANGAYDIYLPKTLDLSDESVVYRLVAEIVSKSDGFIAMSSAVAYADISNPNQALQPETASAFSIDKYPVGTRATLATSVQQQRQNGGSPPDEDYRRQLVRLLSGPKPGIRLTLGVFTMGPRDIPATHLEVRFALQKMETRSPASIEWAPASFTLGTPIVQGSFNPPPTAVVIAPDTVRVTVPAGTVAGSAIAEIIVPLDTTEVADPAHAQHRLSVVPVGTFPLPIFGYVSLIRNARDHAQEVYLLSSDAPSLATSTSTIMENRNGDPWVWVDGLKAWLDSPTRSVLIWFSVPYMGESVFDGQPVDVRISLSKQIATSPQPPVLHYRDPADGVFKPLTDIRVRGFTSVDPPPAPVNRSLEWGFAAGKSGVVGGDLKWMEAVSGNMRPPTGLAVDTAVWDQSAGSVTASTTRTVPFLGMAGEVGFLLRTSTFGAAVNLPAGRYYVQARFRFRDGFAWGTDGMAGISLAASLGSHILTWADQATAEGMGFLPGSWGVLTADSSDYEYVSDSTWQDIDTRTAHNAAYIDWPGGTLDEVFIACGAVVMGSAGVGGGPIELDRLAITDASGNVVAL